MTRGRRRLVGSPAVCSPDGRAPKTLEPLFFSPCPPLATRRRLLGQGGGASELSITVGTGRQSGDVGRNGGRQRRTVAACLAWWNRGCLTLSSSDRLRDRSPCVSGSLRQRRSPGRGGGVDDGQSGGRQRRMGVVHSAWDRGWRGFRRRVLTRLAPRARWVRPPGRMPGRLVGRHMHDHRWSPSR